MKKYTLLLLFSILALSAIYISADFLGNPNEVPFHKTKEITNSSSFDVNLLKEGDVIFQTSNSGQSLAIQKATGSKYSHVGILFKESGKWLVYEAIQPVIKTPIEDFIARGDDQKFTVSRYIHQKELTSQKLDQMRSFFQKLEGKSYDIYFEWSDAKWYCSELVWKMYNAVGITISEHEKFGQFNLEDPLVQQIIADRYPNGAPLDEIVITPKGIYESSSMQEVFSNY